MTHRQHHHQRAVWDSAAPELVLPVVLGLTAPMESTRTRALPDHLVEPEVRRAACAQPARIAELEAARALCVLRATIRL